MPSYLNDPRDLSGTTEWRENADYTGQGGLTTADAYPDLHDEAYWESLIAEREEERVEVAAQTPNLFQRGDQFVLEVPATPPAVWGEGEQVLWAEGEALMVAGPQGVGKSTIALQLVRAKLGLVDRVLGFPVRTTGGRVLYLAMDRPSQLRRAAHRLFRPEDKTLLAERLVVWTGPPPYDMAKRTDILALMAKRAGADTVIVDSLKDAAIGLSADEVGAGYNRCRQQALAEGVEVLELHHNRKAGTNGSEPRELSDVYGSTWLTSGTGSVLMLWGDAGDPVVSMRHLKQPMTEVGPYRVVHDHRAGTSKIEQGTSVYDLVRASGYHGLTAKEYAVSLFETDTPDKNEIEKARRKLDKLVVSGKLHRTDGGRGGGRDRSPAAYHLTAEGGQGQ